MSEQSALAFARDGLGSVWSLEALALLMRDAGRHWSEAEMEREMRASAQVVGEAIRVLSRVGLAARSPSGGWHYAAASPALAASAAELLRLYELKPMAVVKEILASPTSHIRVFADAFKLRK